MKILYQIVVVVSLVWFFSVQVHANSFENIESKLQSNAIDAEQLSDLLGKQYSDWQSFTPNEKQLAVKGIIISLEMKSANNDVVLDRHAQASIQCMQTKSHGLAIVASEDISLPIVRCITDTYEQYCKNCTN